MKLLDTFLNLFAFNIDDEINKKNNELNSTSNNFQYIDRLYFPHSVGNSIHNSLKEFALSIQKSVSSTSPITNKVQELRKVAGEIKELDQDVRDHERTRLIYDDARANWDKSAKNFNEKINTLIETLVKREALLIIKNNVDANPKATFQDMLQQLSFNSQVNKTFTDYFEKVQSEYSKANQKQINAAQNEIINQQKEVKKENGFNIN